jgi:uncharacterized spore protein YtfJ
MDVMQMIDQARDAITVRRVFGDPVERDGLTIIPAASVQGGGGGGGGADDAHGSGSGGGFGIRARPVGAYVIRDGKVRWEPALDLNRVILGGQIVGIVALLTLRTIVKTRHRHQRQQHRHQHWNERHRHHRHA